MKREDFVAREELLAWVDQSFRDFTVGKPHQVVEQIKEIIWQAAQRETEAKTAHIADLERQLAEAKAAVLEGFVVAPNYRGYAHLGTGNYILNHSRAGEPAEFVASIASDAEKAGRTVGDLRPNDPSAQVSPDAIAVRIRFENPSGLDALELQLRLLREEHFPESLAAPIIRDEDEAYRYSNGMGSGDPIEYEMEGYIGFIKGWNAALSSPIAVAERTGQEQEPK